jgi:predicted amidohydrolase YtcJ
VTTSRTLNRRQFLKAVGLGLGSLAGATLACGRTGQEVPPATTTAASLVTNQAPVTATSPPTVTPAAVVSPTTPAGPPPDLVLVHGKVMTMDAADHNVQAVAVQGGRIQAVGSDVEIMALAGPETQIIDLAGQVMTPGLIDAHNHLQVVGLTNSYYLPLMPPDVRSLADLTAGLKEAAAQTPAGEWIQGYFLGITEGRLPNRLDLDQASTEHPIWLLQQGGHYGSANSLALRIAGIDANTPDPEGGVIGREADGQPDGVFYNHRAMDLLRQHAPRYTPEMVHNNIVGTLPLFAAYGITSLQDNNVRGLEVVGSYLEAGRQGAMSLRGAIYYTLEWPTDLDRALNELPPGGGDDFMRLAGYKFLLDGQALMAFCHEPHSGVRWDLPTWDPKAFKAAVRALHDTGLQICVHCIGDAAVDLTVDAYEEAMNANPRPDPRHRVEHAILTKPDTTRRMRDLGIVVSTQPAFIRLAGDYWPTVFGQERSKRLMVTREWLDGGVALALGSDAPTVPWYSPQATLAAAVSRLTPSNKPLEPGQALTIQEALRAHTIGSAYAIHEEAIKGSIEPGKLADLAVWTEDPTTAPPQRLWQMPMAMTLVGGKVVYQA